MKKHLIVFAIIIATLSSCRTDTNKIISVQKSDRKPDGLEYLDVLFKDSSKMCFAIFPDTLNWNRMSAHKDTLNTYKITKNSAFLIGYTSPFEETDSIDIIIPSNFKYNGKRFKVNGIAAYGFRAHGNIKSITIPNTVTFIGEWVFEDCDGLKHVIMPNSVIEIGEGAFAYCEQLEEMPISNKVKVIRQSTYYGCSRIKEINIPNSVISIEKKSFSGAEEYPSHIVSINIPQSVQHISNDAFQRCNELKAIKVHPDNCNYSSIEGVLFSKDVSVLHVYPAGKTESIFDIPSTVTKIEDKAFAGNRFISTINIPSSVKEIGEEAFGSCTGLTSIIIPNSLTTIKAHTFSYCSCLSSVSLPSSITIIGCGAFKSTGITSITIPNSVIEIDESCFSDCKSLSNVDLSNSLSTIDRNVFQGCTNLRNITFPYSVRTIKSEAFSNSGLISLKIPNTIRIIEPSAFRNCRNLVSLELTTPAPDIAGIAPGCHLQKLIFDGKVYQLRR